MICLTMYLIATSHKQNPSQFVFRSENALELNGVYEVAVKSVSHAPSSEFNVTEDSNHFIVSKKGDDYESRDYSIPPGCYRNGAQLLVAMQRAISTKEMQNLGDGADHWPIPEYTADETTNVCSLAYNHDASRGFVTSEKSVLRFFKIYMEESPLHLIPPKISAKIEDFPRHPKLGHIYSSIVPQAHTDYRLRNEHDSRFFAMFPFDQKSGYNHYEFVNPSYFKVRFVHFSEIQFVICDNMGKLFEFSEDDARDYPTSMVLHFRKVSYFE